MTVRAILLVDHGSRLAEANAVLEGIASLVAAQTDADTIVAHAHLELASPSIPEAIDALAARGVTELIVHPYFLAPGRHATSDVPRIAHEAAGKHAMNVRVTGPLGVHELLAKLVVARCEE